MHAFFYFFITNHKLPQMSHSLVRFDTCLFFLIHEFNSTACYQFPWNLFEVCYMISIWLLFFFLQQSFLFTIFFFGYPSGPPWTAQTNLLNIVYLSLILHDFSQFHENCLETEFLNWWHFYLFALLKAAACCHKMPGQPCSNKNMSYFLLFLCSYEALWSFLFCSSNVGAQFVSKKRVTTVLLF